MIFDIFYQVTLPLIVLIAIGYGGQKLLGLDARTLNRFVVYILSPVYLVHAFSTAPISFTMIGATLWLTALQSIGLLAVGIIWVRICRMSAADQRLGAFAISYPNSGNYGLPFINLALGAAAVPVQGIASSIHGIMIMSVGLQFLAGKRGNPLKGVLAALTSPFTPAVLIGITIKAFDISLPLPIAKPIDMIAQAFVPVAVMMLGVQLAASGFSRDIRSVITIVVGSMVVAPLVTYGVMALARFMGWQPDPLLFKLLILNAALPIGVLLAMFAHQWNGNTELAGSVVLASTLISPFTLTIVLWLLRRYG